MTVSTSKASSRKTVSAVAAIVGDIHLGMAKFEMALGTDGIWRMRTTTMGRDGNVTSGWSVIESPLAAFGIEAASIAGDVTFWRKGQFNDVPGLGAYAASDAFVCGDIGHRWRLPRV